MDGKLFMKNIEAGKIRKEYKMEKVYCRNCASIKKCDYYVCTYKENVKMICKEDWFEIVESEIYLKDCNELNKYNDCKWYEERQPGVFGTIYKRGDIEIL